MDLVIAFLVFALAMVCSLIWGGDYGMLGALVIGLAAFYTVARQRGFQAKALVKMMGKGLRRSLIVVRVFVLIGLLTALWRSSGTIAFFVYHGVRLIPPSLFLLAAFLLASLLSYALGTSFGIVGTVGVILMTLARSGGVPPVMTAGAVLSGAYFGDRAAPASSCANLVATVTGTELYGNVKRMLRSAVLPMCLCVIFYGILSVKNPLSAGESALVGELADAYRLSWLTAIPAVIMLILPLCKIEVRKAILLSSLCAFAVTVFLQGMPITEALKACVFGYRAPQALADILSGGGLISMLKVAGIVALSGTYSGIFEGTEMLSGVQDTLGRLTEKLGTFGVTLVTSAGVGAVFCNQTIGVMMVEQLLGPVYKKQNCTREELALDISCSVVVMVGLCPWCIACAVPLSMMGVGLGALPFAALLYLIPICRLATKNLKKKAA